MKLIAIIAALILSGCSSANKEEIKSVAPSVWAKNGFEIVAYEGYTFGGHIGPGYGGANVWYVVKRQKDNGIIYHGYIKKWGDEYHIYSLQAIDAIKPN